MNPHLGWGIEADHDRPLSDPAEFPWNPILACSLKAGFPLPGSVAALLSACHFGFGAKRRSNASPPTNNSSASSTTAQLPKRA